MNQASNVTWAMTDQNRQISAIFAEQRSRLRNFIRRRAPDPRDAEDILRDAFYKLVEANRLLMSLYSRIFESVIHKGFYDQLPYAEAEENLALLGEQ